MASLLGIVSAGASVARGHDWFLRLAAGPHQAIDYKGNNIDQLSAHVFCCFGVLLRFEPFFVTMLTIALVCIYEHI
jgi:hypothetical protein